MGMVASQARFLSLTSRLNDLEFQVQQVNQKRTIYTNNTLEVYQQIITLTTPNPSEYDFETEAGRAEYDAAKAEFDAQYAQYNAQSAFFQASDRNLEMQLKNLDTQHQAVQTELDAVKKVIDKNIDLTFKTFA